MPRAPRSRHLLVLVLAVVAVVAATAPNGATAATTAKPNIVLLILDDMAWSTFSPRLMPATYSRLVDRGVLFERTYIDTPMCCPSRSQILTGLYEHHTGVDGNDVPYTGSTIVQALHDRGYRTMLAGKYLNSLSCRPRREFDRWVCAGKGAPAPGKVDPWLEVDGDWTKFQGYQADVLAEQVVNFVQATPTDTPFFAMWTPVSPHLPVEDDRYASMAVDPVRTPWYDLDTMDPSWPMWMRRAPLSGAERADLETKHEQMAQANRSLDDAVARILDGLGGRLDNTMVVLLSDNGYEYGEHRRAGKVDPFEESVRVPMVIRYPPAHDPSTGSVTQALAQNVDLAPTIADLVGFPWRSDGVSLEPVLSGTKARCATQR